MDERHSFPDEERRLLRLLTDTRKSLKVTQQQLGEVFGISAQQWSKFELGKNRLQLSRFLVAMDYLRSIAQDRPSIPSSVLIGFAEAEQTIYGLPKNPNMQVLEAIRSLRDCLDRAESALLKAR